MFTANVLPWLKKAPTKLNATPTWKRDRKLAARTTGVIGSVDIFTNPARTTTPEVFRSSLCSPVSLLKFENSFQNNPSPNHSGSSKISELVSRETFPNRCAEYVNPAFGLRGRRNTALYS